MQIKPPQSWGEVIALLVLLGSFAGYAITQHERISGLEKSVADRPVLMERRDRENDSLHEEVRELRQKLLCPCHD